MSGATAGWPCPICNVEQPRAATYCSLCLYAKPLDRRGVPQLFAGYGFHFNGLIPKSLIHPSHSVEWRMAERHGAVCLTTFDTSMVRILIYRQGYERSAKCIRCVEDASINVLAVPITWMLDCLLHSRQIHPTMYALKSIPPVATMAATGFDLPHYRHPYYVINNAEYSIPTSFPPEVAMEKTNSGITPAQPSGASSSLPPMYKIDEFQCKVVDVYDAVVRCATGANRKQAADAAQGDEDEGRSKGGAHIELLISQQRHNVIDSMLFSGLTFVLSPALQADNAAVQALTSCGASIKSGSSPESLASGGITHVIYAHKDKKCDLVIMAAYLQSTKLPALRLAESNWVEDCLLVGELLPLGGMYVPTPKLIETLQKKYSKRHA